MLELVHRDQPRSKRLQGRAGGRDTDDGGVSVRPNPPDVQIADTGIAWRLDRLAGFIGDVGVGSVQQDGSRIAQETP